MTCSRRSPWVMMRPVPNSPQSKPGFRFSFPGGWRRSLLAVLLGNLLYFASLEYLPQALRHQPSSLDLGLLVDFAACVAVFRLSYFVWRGS